MSRGTYYINGGSALVALKMVKDREAFSIQNWLDSIQKNCHKGCSTFLWKKSLGLPNIFPVWAPCAVYVSLLWYLLQSFLIFTHANFHELTMLVVGLK